MVADPGRGVYAGKVETRSTKGEHLGLKHVHIRGIEDSNLLNLEEGLCLSNKAKGWYGLFTRNRMDEVDTWPPWRL